MARATAASGVKSPPASEITARDEVTLAGTPEFERAVEQLVTEDDTPVDNMFSETQQRLLTGTLKESWDDPGDGRPFVVAANVGVFRTPFDSPLVPDVFLSLDVSRPQDWWDQPGRSYLIWHYGKPPEIVIEIVSNAKGGQTGAKLQHYAEFEVPYYIIFDPQDRLKEGTLRAFELASDGRYVPRTPDLLPGTGLGLKLWAGHFENDNSTWLRWQDTSGTLIPTAAEGRLREKLRADEEKERAEQAENRNAQLISLLRAHGIDPDGGQEQL